MGNGSHYRLERFREFAHKRKSHASNQVGVSGPKRFLVGSGVARTAQIVVVAQPSLSVSTAKIVRPWLPQSKKAGSFASSLCVNPVARSVGYLDRANWKLISTTSQPVSSRAAECAGLEPQAGDRTCSQRRKRLVGRAYHGEGLRPARPSASTLKRTRTSPQLLLPAAALVASATRRLLRSGSGRHRRSRCVG